MDVVMTAGTVYKTCKASVKLPPPANQHPIFYRPDALLVIQPTLSEHWRSTSCGLRGCKNRPALFPGQMS